MIVNERVKVYRFKHVADQAVITDSFEGESYTVVGSAEKNILLAFKEKNLMDRYSPSKS